MNQKSEKREEIIVDAFAPNDLKDILIGGGTMLAGICWLTYTAFKKGSYRYEECEYRTMTNLGLIDPKDDDDFTSKDEYTWTTSK